MAGDRSVEMALSRGDGVVVAGGLGPGIFSASPMDVSFEFDAYRGRGEALHHRQSGAGWLCDGPDGRSGFWSGYGALDR